MGEIIKYDNDLAITNKLDHLLKSEAQNGKLDYLLVVRLKSTNRISVSSHGSRASLIPLKKFIKKFIKNY